MALGAGCKAGNESVGWRYLRAFALCSLVSLIAATGCSDDISSQRLAVRVAVANPVQDARVVVWSFATGEELADRYTGQDGIAYLDIGASDGLHEICARNGHTQELIPLDASIPDPPPLELEWRQRMCAYLLIDVVADYRPERNLTISPLTAAAAAMINARYELAGGSESLAEIVASVHQSFEEHIGEEIVHGHAIAMHESLSDTELRDRDTAVFHGFALAGIAGIADLIRREDGSAAWKVDELEIARLLVEDAGSDENGETASLDGTDENGRLSLGNCPRAPGCTERDTAECDTVCDLDANTWRADWADAIEFRILTSELNQTGLEIASTQAMLEQMRVNTDSKLFPEGTPPRPGMPPVIQFEETTLIDESKDTIDFLDPDTAVPTHTPSTDDKDMIVLGRSADVCPIVRKHVTRMDDSSDNPVFFRFSAIDHQGAGEVEYRLIQRPLPGSTGEPSELKGWVSGDGGQSMDDGDDGSSSSFELAILSRDVPELATSHAIFELEVRIRDASGLLASATRCWENVPLAAPLFFSEPSEVLATEPRSLHAFNLEPGNNLADLLNGALAPDEGKGLIEFNIKNGTDESVYLTLDFEQSLTSFTKSWEQGIAPMDAPFVPAPDCIEQVSCRLATRLDIDIDDQEGVLDNLATGVIVLQGSSVLLPCAGCAPNQYLISPPEGASTPSVYRVMLVSADLSSLAPRLIDEPVLGNFEDFSLLSRDLPLSLTGQQYDSFVYCDMIVANSCQSAFTVQEYRALLSAEITTPYLRVISRTRAHRDLAPGAPVEHVYPDYRWISSEPDEVPRVR